MTRRLPHHRPDLLDHGHLGQPGGQLRLLVLGGGRPELRHHATRTASVTVDAGPAHDHRLVGHRRPTAATRRGDAHRLGPPERRDGVGARERADVLDHGHVVEPGRHLRHDRARARSTPTTPSRYVERHHHGHPGTADHHRLLGHDDLRRSGAGHQPQRSGLQNGENVSVLGAGLSCTTTASPTSPVGTYPTSCSGATDPNYTISYVGGNDRRSRPRRCRSRRRRTA